MGHHQRVSTQLGKEMAIDRYVVDAEDVSEHLGEDAFDAGRRVSALIRNHRRFSHCPSTMTFTLSDPIGTHASSGNSRASCISTRLREERYERMMPHLYRTRTARCSYSTVRIRKAVTVPWPSGRNWITLPLSEKLVSEIGTSFRGPV